MYPVSTEYLNKITSNDRLFKSKITIDHKDGTLVLYDKDISMSSIVYNESTQSGEEFTIGATVASDLSFTILNKPQYKDINFMGARVMVTISLLIKEGADAHFLQPSQPSKMLNSDDLWEDVPLGIFNIDRVNKLRNTIELKAIDNMVNLNKPYSLSKLSYPASLYQIYVNICNVADVQIATTTFPNKDYVVKSRPEGDLTLRDILGYVAELSGTFARFNRTGGLELSWYKSSGITIEPSNRFDFKTSDDIIQIKGVMFTVDDTTYLTGSDSYAIDLSDNQLLQGNYDTVLPNIFNNIKDTIFVPYTSNWQGNPAIQSGDIITQIDVDGKVYDTLITKSTYRWRAKSYLEAKGLPDISKGYKGNTSKRIAQIKRVVEKEVGDIATTLEQAQLNATELLANMLGGYIVKDEENGILYIADNPNISLAKKVWKYGIDGFGYSSTGVDGVYTTAVTADGSIVAMLVSANIITADMIQAGILQSKDGSTWINLDNGQFSLASGLVTIDKDKVRVSHGSGQYSEIRANGIIRKWLYGEARYLNDMYVTVVNEGLSWYQSQVPNRPNMRYITLPQSFRDRTNLQVQVFPISFGAEIGRKTAYGEVSELSVRMEIEIRTLEPVTNTSSPYVGVNAWAETPYYTEEQYYQRKWWELTYVVMVIGS